MTAPTTTDPRILFGRAAATCGTVLGAVTPEQMRDATPCTELDVRALLRHTLHDLMFVTAIGRGDDPFSESIPAEVADGGWADAWAAQTAAFGAAWADDAALDRIVKLPWSELSGAETIVSMMSMIVVHTWDIAHATGQRPDWDEEVVEAAFESLHQGLPAEGRDNDFTPFDDVVRISGDAPTIDRLVAWAGRQP